MSDDDSVLDGIGEELKKFGKSATSQVTGDDSGKQQSSDTSAASQLGKLGSSIVGQVTGDSTGSAGAGDSLDAAGQLGGFGKSVVGQIAGGDTSEHPHAPSGSVGLWDQIKAFGLSALGQVSGADLEQMRQKDNAQSIAGETEVKAKIQRIYEEHAQREKQEEHYVKQEEKQVEEQQKELAKEEKKQQLDVQIAQTKANAEIKNLGAE